MQQSWRRTIPEHMWQHGKSAQVPLNIHPRLLVMTLQMQKQLVHTQPASVQSQSLRLPVQVPAALLATMHGTSMLLSPSQSDTQMKHTNLPHTLQEWQTVQVAQ